MTIEQAYPFADVELARKLERTEAQGNIDFVEARAQAFPDSGARWIEIGGCFAMFDGVGSPLTQTFGLGINQAVTKESLGELEQFFLERETEIFHEVSPLADASTLALLNEGNYQPLEYSNVLFRPINKDFRLQKHSNNKLHVRLIAKSEADLWANTAAKGWGEFPQLEDFMREFGGVTARSAARSFLAELDGKPIATGALTISGAVALLAGASTIPEARRQGAQLALLEGRLRYAADQGCTIAMMVASPGSGSQRNAERHGFRLAYTRTKWKKN